MAASSTRSSKKPAPGTRYPGEGPEVSPEKARAAVDIAARVRETVREALDEEGMTLKADG